MKSLRIIFFPRGSPKCEIVSMQNEATKLVSSEDEKGKAGAGEDLTQKIIYTKEDIFNPVIEYNTAVLYSYTKNFAFAIDTAVKLLVALDPIKDSYLFFKTAFFLLVSFLFGWIRIHLTLDKGHFDKCERR